MRHLRFIGARHPRAVLAVAFLMLTVFSSAVFARQALSVQELRFIGEQRIPHKHVFTQTTVGGLSGNDYEDAADTWFLVRAAPSAFDAEVGRESGGGRVCRWG